MLASYRPSLFTNACRALNRIQVVNHIFIDGMVCSNCGQEGHNMARCPKLSVGTNAAAAAGSAKRTAEASPMKEQINALEMVRSALEADAEQRSNSASSQ